MSSIFIRGYYGTPSKEDGLTGFNQHTTLLIQGSSGIMLSLDIGRQAGGGRRWDLQLFCRL